MTDFSVSGSGTVYLVTAHNDAATSWVEENVDREAWNALGPAFAVEHRYIENLVGGMLDEGFTVEVNGEEVILANDSIQHA